MNRYLKPSHLPFVTLTAGALGLILRIWLKLAGTDEKGLLVTTHPAHILIFVLTALALAYMLLCVRPLDAVKRYADLFPRGKLACFGIDRRIASPHPEGARTEACRPAPER